MRIDLALVNAGLARSRNQAAQLLREGRVKLNGEVVLKAATPVSETDLLEADVEQWVSRAAYKLLGALAASKTVVPGRVLDAGASTGGFTQVCLEAGAETVYAVDVGHGQLAQPIRDDPRVIVREGLNLRDICLADLDGEPVELIVGDVSFISLTLIMAPMLALLTPTGTALLLVKPQFEVGRESLGSGGVVRDPKLRQHAVQRVIDHARSLGFCCDFRSESVLPGTNGNVEYFIRLTRQKLG